MCKDVCVHVSGKRCVGGRGGNVLISPMLYISSLSMWAYLT